MIEILKKVIQPRVTIPILSQVFIKNGIGIATDMDLLATAPIHAPQKLENGMYFPQGMHKGLFIRSDLPHADFPMLTHEGKEGAVITLEAKQVEALEWVLKAASTEAARYYLNSIFFDHQEEQAVAVATCGHRLHMIDVVIDGKRPEATRKKVNGKLQTSKPVTGTIIPTKAIKSILDCMKAFDTRATIYVYEKTFMATFPQAVEGLTIQGRLIDGTYPDWRRVLPKDYKLSTFFDPAQIKAILPELKIYGKVMGHSKLSTIAIGNGEAKLDGSLPEGIITQNPAWPAMPRWDFTAGFNINYLVLMPGGVVRYKDPAAPFLFEDRRGEVKRRAILMPLRLDDYVSRLVPGKKKKRR